MRLVFEDQGWEDYTSWLKGDPSTGIGKPESLKYFLPGAWSRRIDDEHRLVYLVTDK
ncbi:MULTISPECIES: Txe/YoeB family addiction module toxin [Streptomyces]|uniref:Txe/YoeB family addiction module toxin n=1 Tax=Streptomyces TaxID=1883 RepID=UPI00099C366B|nr:MULTISPECIES: Txe/YoeB family addiction module toxin [Streptomyces]